MEEDGESSRLCKMFVPEGLGKSKGFILLHPWMISITWSLQGRWAPELETYEQIKHAIVVVVVGT